MLKTNNMVDGKVEIRSDVFQYPCIIRKVDKNSD